MRTLLVILTFVAVHTQEIENGDLIFQSLSHNQLIDAIESSTKSPYSHCGIAVKKGDGIIVLEAIGPVKETPLKEYLDRGRDGKYSVYRIRDSRLIPEFIKKAYQYIGRPYDIHYRMDDENIYCSELIYKAMKNAHNIVIAKPDKLGDLDWRPILPVITAIEGGNVPLDRLIITPVALTRANMVKQIYSNY